MSYLDIKKISKSYGEKQALADFSFSIDEGEIVGLIGRNGAGKTTLLNCLAGNILPDSGEIFFEEIDLLKSPFPRNEFGILIQPSFLDYMNTYDNLRLLLNAQGIWDNNQIKKMSDDVLEMVGLKDKGKIYVKQFSFGMKQRLGFAQALLSGKKLLILDEPFVGLDVDGRAMVKDYIRQYAKDNNIAIIFSDHNLDEVKSLCERVIVIRDGKKVADTVAQGEKIYEINISKISSALASDIVVNDFVSVNSECDKVIVTSDNQLHTIIEMLVQYTKIKSIDVIDDFLERMI